MRVTGLPAALREGVAVYDAAFQLDGGLAYAREDTPEPLKDTFAALLESLGEVAGDGIQPGLFTCSSTDSPWSDPNRWAPMRHTPRIATRPWIGPGKPGNLHGVHLAGARAGRGAALCAGLSDQWRRTAARAGG
ncbi:hypothetical protein [Streptomyces sp. NPDC048225]|uniref:hypothetical protein n=1 Tax=Streptomyces sp. NPDC048225 TaxID=3365518 RepID=UPI00371CD39D